MTNKKLGLLLLPLIPLSAVGIVEIASHIMPVSEPAAVHCVHPVEAPVVKFTKPGFSKPHFAPEPETPPLAVESA